MGNPFASMSTDINGSETINDHGDDVNEKHSTVRALTAFDGNATFESSQAYYNEKWAETYDNDMVATLGYRAPKIIAKVLDSALADLNAAQRAALKILDVGCGTGLVGQELRAHGFENIDGLDPSQSMLEKARSRPNVYKNLIRSMVEVNKPVEGVEPGSYDIITSSASFAHAHVPPAAMRELVKLVKPHTGLLAICYRPGVIFEGEREYLENMARVQQELLADGTFELVHDEMFERYVNYNGWRDGRMVVYRRTSK